MTEVKEIKVKNINDLRTILSEEIDNLRAGKTTPANINAITNATGKIFSSIKLEMEYVKLLGEKPSIPFLQQHKEAKKGSNESETT